MFFTNKSKVFIYNEEVDMRCGFEKLSYLVREQQKKDVLEGDIFLFLGRNKKRAKVLYFDKTGLVLISKRLEKGKFMGIKNLFGVTQISGEELKFLLSGSFLRFSKQRTIDSFLITDGILT